MRIFAVYDEGSASISIYGSDDESIEAPTSPFIELDEEDSRLPIRYKLIDGAVVDYYPGYSDEDILAMAETPEAPVANDLPAMQRAALEEVRNYFDTIVTSYKCDAAPYEVATWETQRIEYSEWVKNNDAAIPYCRALAAGRGIPLDDLMGKIYIKITRLAAAQGQQHAIETMIASATSAEELDAILQALPR